MAKHPSDRYTHRWGMRILALILILMLAAGLLWLLVFRVNTFTLHLQLVGEPEILIEYGETYQEPGIEAWMTGSLFCKKGFTPKSLALETEGQVDADTLGRYTLVYTARCMDQTLSLQRKVAVVDTQCPEITLWERPEHHHAPDEVCRDMGYTAIDNYDGDITGKVKRIEEPDKIIYSVIDSSGNPAWVEWEVPLLDQDPPVITLEGGNHVTITVGQGYRELGFSAMDAVSGDLTDLVETGGEVDWLTPGTYQITYMVSDAAGNVGNAIREVEVAAVPRPERHWPDRKTIYLTFDDGPGPYTRQLLDVLDKYGVKATFFVTNSGYSEEMKQIVKRGHSIGIHTVSHEYAAIYASPEAYFADLYKMQNIIYETTGVKTTLMRFPGGGSNTISKKSCEGIMTILTEAVQDAGFQYFDWNVDSNDAGGAKDPETVLENVIKGIKSVGTSIVLQHDIHDYSVEAVEKIIKWGKDNGYDFQPLTENSPAFHHGVYN